MNNDHDIFIPLKNDPALRLTDAERATMRAELEERTRRAPETVHVPTALPSPYFSFFTRPYALIAAVLMLAVVGSGTAAASGAVPGDTLYAVKVHVNENVEQALAFTDDAKADVEIRHVEERLKEVELLAAEGDEDRASVAVEKAQERIVKAKEKLRTLQDAKDSEETLSFALSAHADILSAQSEGSDGPFARAALTLMRSAEEDGEIERDAVPQAERVRAFVAKAHDRLRDEDIDEESRAALTEELARITSETDIALELGGSRTLAELSREAYRAFALADAAERITERTGRIAFIRFDNEREEGDGGEEVSTVAVRTKSTEPEDATAMTMMVGVVAEDASTTTEEIHDEDDEGEEEDEQPRHYFERRLEFRVFDRDDERRPSWEND